MVKPKTLFDSFSSRGISKFSGVPDSLLKYFCAYVTENSSKYDHKITANEGSAIALAAGQYISTGRPSVVYLQNSGFGNLINPLLSLADPKVYGIPMILIVGWRGEPGVKDEPQHIKQGHVMENLIKACEIPYAIMPEDDHQIESFVDKALRKSIEMKSPFVILVKKGTFSEYKLESKKSKLDISREEAIEAIVQLSDHNDIFVSTTGMPSRELFEIREKYNQNHSRDFLTVGSMGHASMIALGISENLTNTHIICLDGDGSSIMHMGNLTSIGQAKNKKLIHIVLNNGAHDSVGGQPTCANEIDLLGIAKSCGYSSFNSVDTVLKISEVFKNAKTSFGPHFIEVKVKKGARKELGRPTSSPKENLEKLMNFINVLSDEVL